MSCQFSPNFEIVKDVPFGLFTASLAENIACSSTYLRPDPGGALIPWLYSLFLLFFHLPAVVLRAVKWQSAQYLSLALALLSLALCIQSYVSTRLAPEEILVWMPLTIMLDVGAMLQMVVLIIEKHKGMGTLRGALGKSFASVWGPMSSCGGSTGEDQTTDQDVELAERAIPAAAEPPAILMSKDDWDSAKLEKDRLPDALGCIAAFILMIALFILQVYGISAGVKGMSKAQHSNLTVKWCSPSFRDFALAISTGNCEIYEVAESSSNGIGCINLPARQQSDWLVSTVAVLAASLVIQLVDVALMICARGRQCRGVVDMQRPWFTMFTGVLTLVILFAFGVFHAARLLPGVTDVVWIYRKEPLSAVGRVCHVTLKAPGLRGMIIGWSDGLFDGWGSVYHGNVVNRAVKWAGSSMAKDLFSFCIAPV